MEQQLPLLRVPINNQSLFSDYYLKELVQADSFWEASKQNLQKIKLKLIEIYSQPQNVLAALNEPETERRIIHRVLDALGHIYSLGPPVSFPEGIRYPDFAFFTSIADRNQAETKFRGKKEFFKDCIAIGDAKEWDRLLDKKIKRAGDPFANHNPSYQIDCYLRATNCRWGILSNGRLWRLYQRDTSYRLDVYYEVNLPELLESTKFEDLLYFYAFFCKEAFIKEATGVCFLDRAYQGSLDYCAKVGSELKENVYEALRLLAQGFLNLPTNNLSATRDIEQVRQNTFIFIYRLLFTLYAEDKGLLPTDNPRYQSYSLHNLTREITEKLDRGEHFSPEMCGYWARVTDLFRLINDGSYPMDVPPYNGGLFDESKHPFLNRHKVGDYYLASAIDLLARIQAAGRVGKGFVHYKDLSIRELGAIYEGLLEHRLRVADQDVAVIKGDKREKFIALSELANRLALKTYKVGEVYLETDRGERKATGSYYTPQYIVEYIIKNTLGPVIEQKKQAVDQEIAALREKLKNTRGYDRQAYERKMRKAESKLIDELLSIKVLDPAMGSGHFLVEAMDYLAKALVEALGVTPTEVAEEEIRWARREIVERCLYGVDLNPLAVELAKVSLWLYSVAKERPLSFLDHHLKLGNSLIGAEVKDLVALPKLKTTEQLGLFEQSLQKRLPIVIGEVMNIIRQPSDSVQQIRQKEKTYQKVLNILAPFKQVADVWTSIYFGNEVREYEWLLGMLESPLEWEGQVTAKPWFQQAQKTAQAKGFFHWELEFPEVFFDENGRRKDNPGFDCVVGNPPYVMELRENKELFRELQKSPVGQKYYEAKMDIFYFFFEHGIDLLKDSGGLGFIVQEYWVSRAHASKLREKLFRETTPILLVDFRGFQVFPDAPGQHNMLVILEKSKEKDESVILTLNDVHIQPEAVVAALTSALDKQEAFHVNRAKPSTLYNPVSDKVYLTETGISDLLAKVEEVGFNLEAQEIQQGLVTPQHYLTYESLSKLASPQNHQIGEGIFVLSRAELQGYKWTEDEMDIIKPFHYAEELDKYYYTVDVAHYVVYTSKGVASDIERNPQRYPNIKAHLDSYQPAITSDNKPYGIHRPRQPEWFEDLRKIIGVRKTKYPKFVVVPELYYMDQSVFIVRLITHKDYSEYFLNAVLNSRLAHWWFYYQKRQGEQLQIDKEVLLHFPIRRIAFSTPKEKRERLLEEAKGLYKNYLEEIGSDVR